MQSCYAQRTAHRIAAVLVCAVALSVLGSGQSRSLSNADWSFSVSEGPYYVLASPYTGVLESVLSEGASVQPLTRTDVPLVVIKSAAIEERLRQLGRSALSMGESLRRYGFDCEGVGAAPALKDAAGLRVFKAPFQRCGFAANDPRLLDGLSQIRLVLPDRGPNTTYESSAVGVLLEYWNEAANRELNAADKAFLSQFLPKGLALTLSADPTTVEEARTSLAEQLTAALRTLDAYQGTQRRLERLAGEIRCRESPAEFEEFVESDGRRVIREKDPPGTKFRCMRLQDFQQLANKILLVKESIPFLFQDISALALYNIAEWMGEEYYDPDILRLLFLASSHLRFEFESQYLRVTTERPVVLDSMALSSHLDGLFTTPRDALIHEMVVLGPWDPDLGNSFDALREKYLGQLNATLASGGKNPITVATAIAEAMIVRTQYELEKRDLAVRQLAQYSDLRSQLKALEARYNAGNVGAMDDAIVTQVLAPMKSNVEDDQPLVEIQPIFEYTGTLRAPGRTLRTGQRWQLKSSSVDLTQACASTPAASARDFARAYVREASWRMEVQECKMERRTDSVCTARLWLDTSDRWQSEKALRLPVEPPIGNVDVRSDPQGNRELLPRRRLLCASDRLTFFAPK